MTSNKTFKYVDNNDLKGFAIVRKAGEPLYLDIPVVNTAAVALVKKYNTNYVFECARMYYGKPPDMAIEKVFGITTFELG